MIQCIISPKAKNQKKGRSPTQTEIDDIAARLKLGRIALGLSAAALCQTSGIKPNTWSQWENAKGRPGLDEAKTLRRSFGWTLDWIYEGDRSGLPLRVAQAIAEYEMRDEEHSKSA